MKHLWKFLVMLAVAIGMLLPLNVSEAAYVAIIPLANKTDNHPDLGQLYFLKGLDAVKSQGAYELLDGERLEKAVEKHMVEGEMPTEEQLKKIAADCGADLVFTMELTRLQERMVNSREGFLELNMEGKSAYYNVEKGIYKVHNYSNIIRDLTESNTRWNWSEQEFGRVVKRELNRAMGKKKISFDRPKLGSLR